MPPKKPSNKKKKKTPNNNTQNRPPSGKQDNGQQIDEDEEHDESVVEDVGEADVQHANVGEGIGQGPGKAQGDEELPNTDAHDKTPPVDKTSGPRVEGADGETRVDGAEEAERVGEGNGQAPGEAQADEELQNTDAQHETPSGDQTSGPRVDGADGEIRVDGTEKAERVGEENGQGGGEAQADKELHNTDAHHETPPEDQTSGPRVEGGDGETKVDGADEPELNAAAGGVEEENDVQESEAKRNSVDVVDEAPVSRPSDVGAVEVSGLVELIKVIEAMGSGAGEQPGVPPELVDRLKDTPLFPAYEALQMSWKKMLVRMSEMEAGQTTLPLSPPLTPQNLSNNSTQESQHQPQQPSHPPHTSSMGTQTDPIPPPPASSKSTQPTPAVPSWDRKELKSLEAGIASLSSKIDSMSQEMSKMAGKEDITKNLGVWDNKLGQVGSQTIEQVKSSAGTTKTHIDKVDSTVAKLSNKLDVSVATMQQSIKQLNDNLAKRPANVIPAPTRVPNPAPRLDPKPDSKASELEAQVKRLRQDLDSTRTELLQADIAFKAALEGIFSAEAEAATTGNDGASRRDTPEIARGIRASTLRLITRCRLLFSLIASNSSPSGTNLAILEGEWAKGVEHLKARDFRERKAIKEKDEAKQELQFFRFLVDQIQRGFYFPSEWKLALNGQDRATFMEKPFDGFASIKRLAEEMYRLQHSRSKPMKSSSSSKPKHEESRNALPPGWAPLST